MSGKPKDARTSTSAGGERRALTGLLPQYRAAAKGILAALHHQELDFVEVTHDANGAVDDFVIGSSVAVKAFQVKWGEYPEAFTFKDLVRKDKTGRTLIADLYEGHKLIKARFPAKRIIVHLYTCHYPSNNDNCNPTGAPPGISFARFLEQVWNPAQAGDVSGTKAEPEAWKALYDASGATEEEFLQFIRDCVLAYGVQLTEDVLANSRDRSLEADQIRELSQLLMDLAVDPVKEHHFSRSDLLKRLNWSHFFELRNRHEFSVTPAYQEIEGPKQKLESALAALPGGYIFVGGSPGSGKSSLLTRTFETRAPKERWIRYYAFIPGGHGASNVRGESENFLHDLTLALEEAGVVTGKSHSTFDRQQLLQRLDDQLQILGKQAKENDTRTVILIDGLDHIPREQDPEVSLLKDLPLPHRIPNGVYILLGSQTDQLKDIPSAVRTVLAEEKRRIAMEPLSPADTDQVIARSSLQVILTEEHRKTIFSLSQGHPLALGLLLNHLRDAANLESVEAILTSTEPYAGEIDNIYQGHWQQIEGDHDVVHTLALIARLRRHIDVNWLHSFVQPAQMAKIKAQLRHLFHREAEDRWFFFHNSFRLFIRQKTATLIAGTESQNEIGLHRILAEQCSKADTASPWAWETLYHLGESGQHVAVVDMAKPEYFRHQLSKYRPLDATADDIRNAMKSASTIPDVTAIVRITLSAAEFSQRNFGISSQEIAALLLRLGKVELAIEHIFDGRQLRVSNLEALRCARILVGIEREGAGRRLFELCSPRVGPFPISGHDGKDSRDALLEWVITAAEFRPIPKLLEFIERAEGKASEFGEVSAESSTQQLRAHLWYRLAQSLYENGRYDDATLVAAKLDTPGLRKDWWFWLQLHRWREMLAKGEKLAAAALIREVLEKVPAAEMDGAQKTVVAEGLFRAEGITPEFDAILGTAKQPDLVKEYMTSESVMPHYFERFRLNRLLRAVGKDQDTTALIPDSTDFEGEGAVYFERAIIWIANIWGDAWHGRQYSDADVRQRTSDLLRFFDRDQRQLNRWRSWHAFSSSRNEFFGLLIDAIAAHGQEALLSLQRMFEEEWESERGHVWSASVRRSVVLSFYEHGSQRDWAIQQIKSLEAWMLDGHDITGRIEECKDHAEAFARLRENDEGLNWLRTMLDTSFGVGYRKDYQLEHWMEWLPRINSVDPEGAASRFSWFAAAARSLDESTEGKSARTAGNELLSYAAAWSPRRAMQLLRWLRDNGPIWYGECLLSVLEKFVESGALSRVVGLAALRDFLPRFLKRSASKLANKYVVSANSLHGRQIAEQDAIEIYNSISTLALPSTRPGWVRGLQEGLKKIGVDPLPIMPVPTIRERDSDDSSVGRSVTLNDGTVLKNQELDQRISTIEGLIEVADQSSEGHFSLRSHFERMAANATIDEAKQLAEAAGRLGDESLALAAISMRLSDLGDRDTAWTVAREALDKSREYGWSKWSDGGTRIQSLRALIKADPNRGRKIAIATFTCDLVKRGSYPSEVAQNLSEIAPLLTDPIPVQAIWSEIQNYLWALCPGLEGKPQPDLAQPPTNDTPDEAFVDLLVDHLTWHVSLLSHGSQHGLGSLLLERNPTAISSIRKLLEQDDDDTAVAAIALLEAVAREDLTTISAYEQELKRLCLHPSLAVWCGATLLLKLIKVQDIPPRDRRPLPAIYSLELPAEEAGVHFGSFRTLEGDVLPDPTGYLDALKPFDTELEWVAELLDRSSTQILHRARAIMGEIHQPADWLAEAERELRSKLKNSGLEFTFRRPRAEISRKAMFRALSELADADVIDFDGAEFIYRALRPCDPGLTLRSASVRPKEIRPIEGLSEYGSAPDGWVDKVATSGVVETLQVDGAIVIGEITTLKRLSWERVTIQIESGLVTPKPPENAPSFSTYAHVDTEKYFDAGQRGGTNHLVIVKEYDGRDNDCFRWIGLNPKVARLLGWSPSRDGLLRWVDAQGSTMSETIWWKDSSLDHQPPELENEVGEGWLVVVTKAGWEAMRTKIANLYRITTNTREMFSEGQRFEKSMRVVQEIGAT